MNNYKLNGLKQPKFIPSQFWRPDIQTQGIFRAVPLLVARGEFLLLSARDILLSAPGLWLLNPASASMVMWPSPLSSKDTCYWI